MESIEQIGPSAKRVHSTWQQDMLPLMTRMLIGLTVFFFVASCVQLIYLHRTIQNGPKADLHEALSQLSIRNQDSNQDLLAATRLKTLATLESTSVEHQYHQASVLLMSRLWISYLGFVTGMILALMGAAFILGKLEDTGSELSAKVSGSADLSFKSASPGLVLAVLGVILMITTIITNHKIEVTHKPIYLRDIQQPNPVSTPGTAAPPLNIPETEDNKSKD
jgi:hypothetical protein